MEHQSAQPSRKAGFDEADLALLGSRDHRIAWIERGQELCSASSRLHVLLDGWAYKYRIFRNGRRQVISQYMSGDVCDLDRLQFPGISCGVQAASRCRVAEVSAEWLKSAMNDNPAIRDLFWSLTVLENVAMSELVLSLGSRTARERTAWFICDLAKRLEARGRIIDGKFHLELTQTDIADMLGLSLVHMNRSLKGLKAEGLIANQGATYTILDLARLQIVAGCERDSTISALPIPPGPDRLPPSPAL